MAGLAQFANNATTTLATAINSSVTSLTVAAGKGSLFPNPTAGQYFYMTLANIAGTVEIVKCTARSTDTFTIVRGQDGTTAASWNSGDKVEQRLVATNLNNLGQLDSTNTWAQAQTFSGGLSGALTGNVTGNVSGTAASITGVNAIAQGGTNNGSLGVVAGGVYYGDGTKVVETAAGTSGQVLTSNGASAPSFQTLSVSGRLLNIQYFTTVGTATYTPTSGTNFVIVEVVGAGGGGGGGGVSATTSGAGGGGGGFARKKITSAFSGVTVTVGTGGTAGSSGSGNGGTGGTSSFGALASATGGSGGVGGTSRSPSSAGGTGSSGDLNLTGGYGSCGGSAAYSTGGSSFYAGVVTTNRTASFASGVAGLSYGGGGSGGVSESASSQAGAIGASGIVIVYEYA